VVTTTITPLGTYRNDRAYPFCPGCGHGQILDHLNDALVELGRRPDEVVIVSDIGCSGLSDQYFSTSAFHGLHGRSITYATGIKLANPNLTVIVIMGDGGTGIGGTHLLSAARRNVGITVLVMNNMNFGMTGGQHSTTTIEGAVTSTTPAGNLEHPLDICATVGVNGAAFVYRGTSFDEDLAACIGEAIQTPGFALLDVWDLCTAYFVRSNKFSRRGIVEAMQSHGFEAGVLYRSTVPGYETAYRAASDAAGERRHPRRIPTTFSHHLAGRCSVLLAGSAGSKVNSAARLIGEGAIRSGLWVSQTSDYPVTVKTGHSLAQVTMTPEPAPILPIPAPDAVVVLSEDGLRQVGFTIPALPPTARVFTTPDLAGIETEAAVEVVDVSGGGTRIPKSATALALGAAAIDRLGVYPLDALRTAAEAGRFADKNLEAIEAGVAADR
jgi:pyruvate/2-oxoacid:ferredoxin oxidoreductase beta subunit/Pyruvate/2-oxoacid:ferredoxin oxidoreductase gamma subunit